MWNSNHHYNLTSEESDFSQESQGTESFQEEIENWEPWSRIFDEAEKHHETQINSLINHYEENEDSENVARITAENALLPFYRKELRKVFLEYLQWMHTMKEIPPSEKWWKPKKSVKIQKDLIGSNQQNLLSVSQNSYSIACMKTSPFHNAKTRPTMNVIILFLDLCFVEFQ